MAREREEPADSLATTSMVETGLGNLRIHHPPGTFAPSPATRLMARVLTGGAVELVGVGLDWGCGTGVLAISAALSPTVRHVVGLDRSAADVQAARHNARRNGVADRTAFYRANGYDPVEPDARRVLEGLRGRLDFVVANPPASDGDDGFRNRHAVLAGAAGQVRPGGVVLLQALSAYGPERFRRLEESVPTFDYEGVVGSTEPAPLDLARPVLEHYLRTYAAEEARGGLRYWLEDKEGRGLTATAALRRWEGDGVLPWGRWQAHRFRMRADPGG